MKAARDEHNFPPPPPPPPRNACVCFFHTCMRRNAEPAYTMMTVGESRPAEQAPSRPVYYTQPQGCLDLHICAVSSAEA